MDFFLYRNKQLYAEDVPLSAIAEAVETPVYCYSAGTLKRHFKVFSEALKALPHRVFFAAKANGNPAVLKILLREGAGIDVVSGGEIRLAMAAGASGRDIVFSGVGKTREEMRFALQQEIFQFNVESIAELQQLNEVAQKLKKKAPVAFRVNPNVDAKTHHKISTGKEENKFGIGMAEAKEAFALARKMPGIAVQGVSVHIGSQLTDLAPFEQAFRTLRSFIEQLRREGHAISTIDLGGGLGVPYEIGTLPPLPSAYGAMVTQVMQGLEGTFLFEPGRLIAGNAGVLLCRVLYVKKTPTRTFVIVDAAMNDLLRPTLYEAHHDIIPVLQTGRVPMVADIVGPVCETGDVFAHQRSLPEVTAGDLVAFRTAGAYGATMSSTYNARLLVPEVLVSGSDFAVIRPRPSYEAMLDAYQMPVWL